jgi:hypothetical protein
MGCAFIPLWCSEELPQPPQVNNRLFCLDFIPYLIYVPTIAPLGLTAMTN